MLESSDPGSSTDRRCAGGGEPPLNPGIEAHPGAHVRRPFRSLLSSILAAVVLVAANVSAPQPALAATVPGIPTSVVATRADSSADVAWAAPTDDGGSAITGFTVTTVVTSSGDPAGAGCTVDASTFSCTVTGLTNGTEYTISVTATNGVGEGAAATANVTPSVTPATVPGAPTITTVVGADAQVTVTWTAPADDGGATISSYTATAVEDATKHCTTATLSCAVTGLANGTAYTFRVVATNSAGPGPASAASAPVTPATVPGAPTGVIATRGDGSARVQWSAPAANGSAIIGYTVTSSPGNLTCPPPVTTLSCTVSGLTNGTLYTFTVVATNGVGPGPASDPSSGVTPAGLPGKPTGVIGEPGDATATVYWSAGVANGSTISSYKVTSSPAAAIPTNGTCTWTTGALACTVTGLTNGTTYTFRVTATNAVGTSVPSDASNAVTPTLGAMYNAIPPYRVLDSRVGKAGNLFHSQVKQTVLVGTVASGVPTDAVAVTGNVTVVSQSRAGFVTVAPALTNGVQPLTSTINFPKGDVRANGVTVPLASGAKLDFMYWTAYTSDTVQILFDVTGYFSTGSGATYHVIAPHRVLDSRAGTGANLFHAKLKQTVLIATADTTVPPNAVAVTGNVTIVSQTRAGFVTVAPALTNGVQPLTSTINFPVGDIRANGVTVPLAAGGNIDLMYWTPYASDTVQILFDVTGYFANDVTGAKYHVVSPYRVLDSRIPTGASLFQSETKQTVAIATVSSTVPSAAVAVTGNVTVVSQTRAGFVTVAPSLVDGVQPPTSTINFPKGDIRANGVTVQVAAGGRLDFIYWTLHTSDRVQILFDVTGYFL